MADNICPPIPDPPIPEIIIWPFIASSKSNSAAFHISKKFNVSIRDLTLWNSVNLQTPLQIGQQIKIFSKYERARGKPPNKKKRTLLYPVKSGDTLSRIASRFSIRVKDIEKWNEIKPAEIIYPGQVLKIILDAGVGK